MWKYRPMSGELIHNDNKEQVMLKRRTVKFLAKQERF